MSSTSKQGKGRDNKKQQGQRQRQEKMQEPKQEQEQAKKRIPSCSKSEQIELGEMNSNSDTNEVELVLHAETVAKELSNTDIPDVGLQSGQQSRLMLGSDNTPECSDKLDNRWDRILRVFARCLIYCSGRIAAGFGVSRQQTAWYKHCWDSPGQRPRYFSFCI